MPIKYITKNKGLQEVTFSAADAAEKYLEEGFQPIPVPYKTKAPKVSGWQNLKLKAADLPEYFSGPSNIGLLLGEPSGGLTDIDIDHPFAQQFAFLLPPTGMIHGRKSKPSSHHFYKVVGGVKTTHFKDVNGSMLVEIRSTGAQTVVPPSVHPSGEQLEWESHNQPAIMDSHVLQVAVSKMAACALLAINWPEKGGRNDSAMAVAGVFLRHGGAENEVVKLLQLIAKAAGDEEWQSRGDSVKFTSEKLKLGDPVTGLPTLVDIMGAKVVEKLAGWLGLSEKGPLSPEDVVSLLNKKYAVVVAGSSVYVLFETTDPVTGHFSSKLLLPKDLKLLYQNVIVKTGVDSKGKDIFQTADAIWLKSPKRRQFDSIVFAPEGASPNVYNLFRGFPIKPIKGDCSLYLNHIRKVICSGDVVLYDYVLNWMAHLIQKPAEIAGTALVLRGKQGTGKGVFVNSFGKLAGSSFLHLNAINQVSGKFNSHLQGKLLIFADEAIWGGNKDAEGALKGLVTEKSIPIEQKGRDIITVRNYMRLVVASNESWAVPVDMDDRRFFVLDVSDTHKEDHKYFGAIEAQMDSGGVEALMRELLDRDISGFQPREAPATPYGFDIKLKSAKPIKQWWHEYLGDAEPADWKQTVAKNILFESYLDWCSKHKIHHPESMALFGKELKKLVPDLSDTKIKEKWGSQRTSHYKLPSLSICKKAFQDYCKGDENIWKL